MIVIPTHRREPERAVTPGRTGVEAGAAVDVAMLYLRIQAEHFVLLNCRWNVLILQSTGNTSPTRKRGSATSSGQRPISLACASG